MILEIKIANYRSIHQEQTLSFIAEKAGRHSENLIPRQGFRLLKAAALFGSNASGKSNLVMAIEGMSQFIRDSATRMNDGDRIALAEPFRLSSETQNAPSRFAITFLLDRYVYTYSFAVKAEHVYEEHLTGQKESRGTETLWFSRILSPQTGEYVWCFGEPIKDTEALLRQCTRSNALTLSLAAQLNVQKLLPLYRYLRSEIRTFDMSSPTNSLLSETASECKEVYSIADGVFGLMESADIGIEKIEFEERAKKGLPETMVAERNHHGYWSSFDSDKVSATPQMTITSYRRDDVGDLQPFDFEEEESKGTQRLFALAGPLLSALNAGSFVVVDELDCSMHPLLTRRLLEMFQSPRLNTKGAQLLFTTHDSVLFDQELFRRDQIWLAEKRNGASEFFALSDIEPPPRNTEVFLRNYLAGRYGGTPQFVMRFEDRESAEVS